MAEISTRAEDAINEDAIVSLAEEMHYPLPEVRRVYETELKRLRGQGAVSPITSYYLQRVERAIRCSRHPYASAPTRMPS